MRGREDERVAAARSAHAAGRFAEARSDYVWTIDFARMTMTFVPPAPG